MAAREWVERAGPASAQAYVTSLVLCPLTN